MVPQISPKSAHWDECQQIGPSFGAKGEIYIGTLAKLLRIKGNAKTLELATSELFSLLGQGKSGHVSHCGLRYELTDVQMAFRARFQPRRPAVLRLPVDISAFGEQQFAHLQGLLEEKSGGDGQPCRKAPITNGQNL
uniref:Uncharacterized protein n=1 Tax=Globodera rostochiensis TaxID=31243 RepID=A0A914HWN4_GLORO